MEAVEVAMVWAAVGAGGHSEAGGLRSEEVGVSAAGASGGGARPPRRLGQRQPGPRKRARGQVALRGLGGAVAERVGGRGERVVVVVPDHGGPGGGRKPASAPTCVSLRTCSGVLFSRLWVRRRYLWEPMADTTSLSLWLARVGSSACSRARALGERGWWAGEAEKAAVMLSRL